MSEILEMFIKRNEDESNEVQTLGDGYILNEKEQVKFAFKTMELGWNDNKKRVSCIPKGVYTVVSRYSDKYKNHFHILDVPNRDFILIHPANYSRQLLGCIGVGAAHIDIDADGLKDVTSSKATMQKILTIMPSKFKLTIV